MATKARIGLLTKNHTAQTIEIAYEGYPEYTGELLKKHFKSSKAIRALLQKGDIIQLEDSLDKIEHDDLQGNAQQHRFIGNISQLAEDTLADYIYLFQESDRTWYLLEEGVMKNI
ncbi:hypothetical protein QE531_05855 [Streptococcus suis]|uniref:hypothetical protein n=1 Tax=Streptococcus suis TaxID=1307 RepID=UPI0014784A66|nr:hypothetical protein [Streptococcus suis]MBY4973860.1 hypothetical protein [Streptococcus suis]URZ91126.1 hypothetical protein [Streptococcus suis]